MLPADHAMPPFAVLGHDPAFAEPLHVGRPNIGDRDDLVRRFEAMLDRRWFSNHGPLVIELEERIAALCGVEHAIATANGTLALQVLAVAAGLTGEVIVPSFTFVATAHALAWQGLQPVFCDIDDSYTLDPDAVERAIGPATSAILGVHVWGLPCDTDRLAQVAERHGIQLFYDSAHALGVTVAGRPIGSFGGAEVLSLHATKFVNAFEGGAVVTDDAALAAEIRQLINFGYDPTGHVSGPGINAKMSEASAAMGLVGLDALESLRAINERNWAIYSSTLAGVPGIEIVAPPSGVLSNHQYVVVIVDADLFGLTADELQAVLRAENVLARRYFAPGVHRLPPYDRSPVNLPVTDRIAAACLCLPTGQVIGKDQIDRIADLIQAAQTWASGLRASGALA